MSTIQAGELNRRLEVLELWERKPGVWEWVAIRHTWGRVNLTSQAQRYSTVGVWAQGAEVAVRRQPLTLHNALRLGEQHLFLTSVLPEGRGHLKVSAALVELANCQMDMDEGGGAYFPGVLTEKYMKFQQDNPYASNTITYVLITPKAIQLQRGGVVAVNGIDYAVQLAHVLDPYKNEYEISRKEDL